MCKKILCIVLAMCMVIPSYTALAVEDNIDNYIDFVSGYNIINGDPDGNFRLDDFVTRAEFTKIAVMASPFRDSVAPNIMVSPFKDVTYQHWAAPYIKLAVSNQIVNGYEDASFRPDNLVSYEEAITMLVKLLGYTNDDFGSSWPYAQIGIANNKGITDGVDRLIGEAISRRDCVMLVYNLLNAKKKDSNTKYISEFDSTITENVVLLATSNEDTSVGASKIATTAGTYEIKFNYEEDDLGRKGSIVVRDGDKITSFIPNNQIVDEYLVTSKMGSDLVFDGKVLDISDGTSTYYKSQSQTYSNAVSSAKSGDLFKVYKNANGVIDYTVLVPKNFTTGFDVLDMTQYIVYSVLDDKVLAYNNGKIEQINFKNSVDVYEEDQKSSFSAIKQNMELGDILNVKYDANGDIEYVAYEEGKLKGPVTVTSSSWYNAYGINPSDVRVVRDGVQTDIGSLIKNDIVYYSEEMGMVLGYSRKIVGVYESASPNKEALTSVNVSGVAYGVESADAFSKLSSGGKFNYGDTVTLLLGKDGEIADVISADETSQTITGYLVDTGNKTYQDANGDSYTSYYAKIVETNGTVSEYKVTKDYKNYKNSVVTLSYSGTGAKLGVQRSGSSVSGTVSYDDMKIGNSKVSSSVEILEVYSTSLSEPVNYRRTYMQRLDGMSISSSNILYMQKNSLGEISSLIIKDVTGDMHTYAVVTSADTDTNSYTFATRNGTVSSNGSRFSGVSKGAPVKIITDKTKSSSVEGVLALSRIDSIISVSQASVTTNDGEEYKLSPEVVVFERSGVGTTSTYDVIPITDVVNGDYSVDAYYDKAESKGGRIRVLIVTAK